jgi:hypothetical protein
MYQIKSLGQNLYVSNLQAKRQCLVDELIVDLFHYLLLIAGEDFCCLSISFIFSVMFICCFRIPNIWQRIWIHNTLKNKYIKK